MNGWRKVTRGDSRAVAMFREHYSARRNPPPLQVGGLCKCAVFLYFEAEEPVALWCSEAPEPKYQRHAWPGNWQCSVFRRLQSAQTLASTMIIEAEHATQQLWSIQSPGWLTFIDPRSVRPTMIRGVPHWGYSYIKAGYRPVGITVKRKYLAFHKGP